VTTGKYCNNFKAEATALRHDAEALKEYRQRTKKQVAIFTDALSVVSTLKNKHSNAQIDKIDSLGRRERTALELGAQVAGGE
jgi:ribonuclease HI